MNQDSYAFLCGCLKDGFSVLKGININYFPKDDKLNSIIQHWAAMLIKQTPIWTAQKDGRRIAETFVFISLNIDNFPTLPLFLRLLPSRNLPSQPLALPQPPLTDQQIAERIQEIRSILKKTKMPLHQDKKISLKAAEVSIGLAQNEADSQYRTSTNDQVTKLSRGKIL